MPAAGACHEAPAAVSVSQNQAAVAAAAVLTEPPNDEPRNDAATVIPGSAAIPAIPAIPALPEPSALDLWSIELMGAAGDLGRARGELATPGLGRQEAAWIARSAFLLEMARRVAAAGDLEEATRQATLARAEVGRVHERWLGLHSRFSDPEQLRLWDRWVDDTFSEPSSGTVLVIDKVNRRLDVYRAGRRWQSMPVELGSSGLERKLHIGDRATPEGRYRVVERRSGGRTRYHKALLLNYPNSEDVARFRAFARHSKRRFAGPGGMIEIHGGGGQGRDWTDGCVALADQHMDRLFELVEAGTPVTIVGTYSR